MTAQTMPSYAIGKKFMQIDKDLRVQTFTTVKHVWILTLFFPQAVNDICFMGFVP